MSLERSGSKQAETHLPEPNKIGSGSAHLPKSSTSQIMQLERQASTNSGMRRAASNLPPKAKAWSRFCYQAPTALNNLFIHLVEKKIINIDALMQEASVTEDIENILDVLDDLKKLNLQQTETIEKLKKIWKIFHSPIDLKQLNASPRLKKLLGINNTTAHLTFRVTKTGQKNPNKFYFLKIHEPEPTTVFSPMSELETVCWAHYRLYINDLVPHDVIPIYDDANYQFIAVASEAIPNFQSFKDSPLTEDDLNLGIFQHEMINVEETYSKLLESVEKLIEHLKKHSDPAQQSTVIGSWYKRGANFVNYFKTYVVEDYPSILFTTELEELKKTKRVDAKEFLDTLLTKLIKRLIHIFPSCIQDENKTALEQAGKTNELVLLLTNRIDIEILADRKLNPAWEEERKLLRSALYSTLQYRRDCASNKEILEKTTESVQRLIEIDKIVRANEINLSEMRNDENICSKINCGGPPITVVQLKKFRRMAGQGKSAIAFLYGGDTDRHPYNLSSDGYHIDFDLSKLSILIEYKKGSWVEKWNIKPNENAFKLTPIDIIMFPILTYASPRCFPSRQSALVSPQNRYTDEQIATYKKLAFNPVFDFFKYKTLLKIILTTPKMHEYLTELYLRKEDACAQKSIDDEYNKLFRRVVDYDRDRLAELRDVMLNMHKQHYFQFQEFLIRHGNFAFNMIKEEFMEDKKRLVSTKKPSYNKLIKEFDMDRMDEDYKEILVATNVPNIIAQQHGMRLDPNILGISMFETSAYCDETASTAATKPGN